MKVLIISYNIGDTASGIISQRVAGEFARQGHEVKTLVCKVGFEGIKENIDTHVVNSFLNKSTLVARALKKAGRIIETLVFEYDWVWIKKSKVYLKQLFDSWSPDLVYCRSTPFEPFFLGRYIKQVYQFKVLMHFTDPSPAISEYPNRKIFIQKQARLVSSLLRFADKISFGTLEMMRAEEDLCGIPLIQKSFISPDVTSDSTQVFNSKNNHSTLHLVYFGYINISRNPKPLFEAIEKLNSELFSCKLYIYSSQAKEFRGYNGVHFVGRNNNREKALSEADILVDLTVEESLENDVYISSKLKDYLLFNRPILSISGTNCATRNLLRNLKTVIATPNNSQSIEEAIKKISEIDFCDDDYEERRSIIRQFSPDSIVNTIIEELK